MSGGAALCDEDDLTDPGADGVSADDEGAGVGELVIDAFDEEELEAVEGVYLSRGDDGAYHLSEEHVTSGWGVSECDQPFEEASWRPRGKT